MVVSRVEPKGIQSIEIGFRILEALEAAPDAMSLKDLAAAAGMSSSKAHFYLTSLLRTGLVAQAAPGGAYEFGPAAIRLGFAALARLDVIRLARPSMLELRAETGDAVMLSVRGAGGPTVVARIEGRRSAVYEIRIGATLSPFSATGRVLMAWLPAFAIDELLERELRELARRDPAHGLTLRRARAILGDVRRDGYAVGTGGGDAGGYFGVAAPVFDGEGVTPAAITLVGDDAAFRTTPGGPKLAALLRAGERISQRLGAPLAAPRAVAPARRRKKVRS